MTIDFRCDGCGRQLRAEEKHQGQKTQCPSCQRITVIPYQLEVVENLTDAVTAQPPALPKTVDSGKNANPSDCPKCGAGLTAGAVLCIECGYDLRTGKRRKTKKRRLQRKFDRSLPLAGRILIGMFAIVIPVFVMLATNLFLWWLIPPALFVCAVFATPYGYIFRFTVRRERKGDLLLKKEFWVCCLPLDNWTINLSGYSEAWTDYAVTVTYDQYGHPIEHERYLLTISGDRKQERVIYDGPDDDLMRDLADLMQYDAGMQIKRR